ncbi:thioredoxin reductase [Microbacterium sorbitolivorans]|uniref:NAD(P)/FAD-dependent oxidoreductase n=1 Tax=Microbacterium sorbitolivorans TaxID=1867410 RepID=A0A367YAH3_9MICO|nr:NAD(P)/FAD-dependent oxidoreductase [Microbacterium sorbitolivorans]RCK62032.1 NAD(P)/FAD-dependent oxidoreductase [Microbacterium sorbitolivorans]GGF43705.1 thioredoxin reductase [Microbacterium sorbitolivorans]
MDLNQWDVIIIGAGPAGLQAAQMLGRSRRRVLVIDGEYGRNRFAAHMHGVLGHDGKPPAQLRAEGRAEAEGYGVVFRAGSVDAVTRVGDAVRVEVAGDALEARALIVATGVRDDLPAIPGLAERWGQSVLHCPFCHGWEVRDRSLAVIATSPMSAHQAEMVSGLSARVTFFSAGVEFPAEARARLAANGVRIVDEEVLAVEGSGSEIAGVRIAGGELVDVDAIFTGGTLVPLDQFLGGLGLARAKSPVGSFLAVDHAGRTSDDRIWAAGNVVSPMANVPMSMGAGAMTGSAVQGTLIGWDTDRALAAA